ncbi:MAG TPA: chemotaxis protein CheW [Polyangiaceae bacterium]
MVDLQRIRQDPLRNLVGFWVGDVSYALPIATIREIVNPLDVIDLPDAPAEVPGVANYRGEVVPVVDLRIRFRLPAAPETRKTKWILIDIGDRLVALIVDAVSGVFGAAGELRPPPLLGKGEDVRGIAGVTMLDDDMVFVLDITRFANLTEPLIRSGSIPPSSMRGSP